MVETLCRYSFISKGTIYQERKNKIKNGIDYYKKIVCTKYEANTKYTICQQIYLGRARDCLKKVPHLRG